jgi:hypothetical protein
MITPICGNTFLPIQGGLVCMYEHHTKNCIPKIKRSCYDSAVHIFHLALNYFY